MRVFVAGLVGLCVSGTPNGQGCLTKVAQKLPYCDKTLDVTLRLEDLSARLTVEELVSRLKSNALVPGVDSVGLPAQNYRVEGNHGLEAYCVSKDGELVCPTSFPIAQGIAASWNRSVFAAFGRVVGREARIWTNANGVAKSERPVGTSVRCPMVNLLRDPRWGRSDESASEDPYLSAEFGRVVVDAIQTEDAHGYRLASAEVKHFAAYSLETNARGESDGRKGFDAVVSALDWMDSYAVPFAASLPRAGAYMCSYNALNGTPACANTFLSERSARVSYGFQGFVESDCDAVGDLVDKYRLAADDAHAAALALNAGTDLDCGDTFDGLVEAVARNLTTRFAVERAFRRAMRPHFRAGLFDGTEASEWARLSLEDVPQHRCEQLEAQRQSLVLLKNAHETLPFARGQVVALVGPLGFAREQLFGPITIGPCLAQRGAGGVGGGYKEDYSCVPTLEEALRASSVASKVIVAQGCGLVANATDAVTIAAAVAAASRADVVILALGAGLETVDEKTDLLALPLPGAQETLARAISALGKPTAAVLVMGNQYAVDGWIEGVPAAIDAFIPSGLTAGRVVVEALFEDLARPVTRFGRLPYTLYTAAFAHEVGVAEMSFSRAPGRGYRYYAGGNVSFAFGHGLSYCDFAFALASRSQLSFEGRDADEQRRVEIKLENVGTVTGDEVLQLYVTARRVQSDAPQPLRQLVDFERLRLAPGAAATVAFTLRARQLSLVDRNGDRKIFPGNYSLQVTNGRAQTLELNVQVTSNLPLLLESMPE